MRPFVALAALLACSHAAPPPPAVERTAEPVDLSGAWNDVDADQVAAAVIGEALADPWIAEWRRAHAGRRPVLRLYPIKNRTAGYIDYRSFTKQIERAFVRSGLVDVVASLEEARDARDERDDQAEHASDATAKAHGQETGSDFIVNGWILSQEDEAGKQRVQAYLTSVEIVETQTQRKVYLGQKRIRKLITRP